MLAILAHSLADPGWAKEKLELQYAAITLPGVPVEVFSVDLDGDSRRDLAMVVAYSEWIQTAFEEHSEMEGIEGLVEILTIVPSVEDRRELWTFLSDASGGFVSAGPPLALTSEVLAVDEGPPGIPLVALTDAGVAALERREDGLMEMRMLVEEAPVISGSGLYLPGFSLAVDVIGDESLDLLIPTWDGLAVYEGGEGGIGVDAGVELIPLPGDVPIGREVAYPLPEVRDVTGDGRPDLVWQDPEEGWSHTHVAANQSRRGFGEPVVRIFEPEGGEDVVHFGDLDGDGLAEWVTRESTEPGEDIGMREEMRLAGAPPNHYRLYRTGPDSAAAAEPYTEFDAVGYTFDGESDLQLPGGFQDLAADGRLDLISITLELSLRKALGVIATHRITLPMDFFVHCQRPDGTFRSVSGLDLSGKFRLNLEKVEVKGLPMFEGDFDGDGFTDFVQFGRGKKVTIHRGGEGCSFPSKPDLVIDLKKEAALMELIRIDDLDADGLSDLMVIQPGRRSDGIETPGVRLDLYISGQGDPE